MQNVKAVEGSTTGCSSCGKGKTGVSEGFKQEEERSPPRFEKNERNEEGVID